MTAAQISRSHAVRQRRVRRSGVRQAVVRRHAAIPPLALLALFMLLALLSAPAGAAARASLSASDIAPGDTVQLTLERDGPGNEQPDLTPLRQDFDVLGANSSTNLEIINGNTSTSTQVQLTLSPKHAGRLTVPPITWGNEHTAALTLNVTSTAGNGGGAGAGAGAAGGGNANISARDFIQTEIDPPQPYVQAAVQVTVRLYASQTLYRPDLEWATGGDALVQQVGDDEQNTTQRNGRTYRVLTRHYLLFPQHSGALRLPGPVLDAQVATGQSGTNLFGADPFAQLFGSAPFGTVLTRPIRLHGDPIVLNVRPRPAGANASYWLPATQVTLTSQWSPVPLQAHAGDPVTVQLHLQAQGLTAAQLPDLSTLWALPGGLKAYPDQAKLHDAAQGTSVVGSRDQTIALIADQPGHFTIPALAVQWWDTTTNTPHQATVPARTLVILPAAGAAAGASASAAAPALSAGAPPATPVPVPAAPALQPNAPRVAGAGAASAAGTADGHRDSMWRWIAAGLATLWLLTIGAWWWSSKRRGNGGSSGARAARRDTATAPDGKAATARPDFAQARAALAQACRRGDAPAARRQLLTWAAARWPATPPSGLSALSRLLNDPDTTALLGELDRACYAGGAWRGDALAERIGELRPVRSARATGRRTGLAPLYP